MTIWAVGYPRLLILSQSRMLPQCWWVGGWPPRRCCPEHWWESLAMEGRKERDGGETDREKKRQIVRERKRALFV